MGCRTRSPATCPHSTEESTRSSHRQLGLTTRFLIGLKQLMCWSRPPVGSGKSRAQTAPARKLQLPLGLAGCGENACAPVEPAFLAAFEYSVEKRHVIVELGAGADSRKRKRLRRWELAYDRSTQSGPRSFWILQRLTSLTPILLPSLRQGLC